MDRVFLDANVLFSAAYKADARVARLWDISGVELLTSKYAVEEAERHLDTSERIARLADLLSTVEVIDMPLEAIVDWNRAGLRLKDVPILEAAIHARATHLLTGDKRDFGPLHGRTIEGVLIERPANYLRDKPQA